MRPFNFDVSASAFAHAAISIASMTPVVLMRSPPRQPPSLPHVESEPEVEDDDSRPSMGGDGDESDSVAETEAVQPVVELLEPSGSLNVRVIPVKPPNMLQNPGAPPSSPPTKPKNKHRQTKVDVQAQTPSDVGTQREDWANFKRELVSSSGTLQPSFPQKLFAYHGTLFMQRSVKRELVEEPKQELDEVSHCSSFGVQNRCGNAIDCDRDTNGNGGGALFASHAADSDCDANGTGNGGAFFASQHGFKRCRLVTDRLLTLQIPEKYQKNVGKLRVCFLQMHSMDGRWSHVFPLTL